MTDPTPSSQPSASDTGHADTGTVPQSLPGSTRSPLKMAVQLLGFAAGLGLLWWCVSLALKPENREQLARLAEADAGSLALLFGTSAATLILNGLIFWVALLPERRIDAGGMLATNAVATALSYLPFKLSVVARFVIHNRRDGLPLLTIAAWMGAVAVVVLASLGPIGLASLWRQRIDTAWWIASGAGVLVAGVAVVAIAGYLSGGRGLARIHRLLDPVAVGPLKDLMRGEAFARLHAVFGMLAHPRAVWASIGLRLADIAAQAARIAVAASILGVGVGLEHAVLVASTYFLIGMLSPFGMLGTREAGSIGIAALLGMAESGESLAVVILAVSATESLVNLAGAALGVAWLRPDRLLRKGREDAEDAGPA